MRAVRPGRGVPESWELYQLGPEQEDVTVAAQPSALRTTDHLAITAARHAPCLMQAASRLDGAWQRRRASRA